MKIIDSNNDKWDISLQKINDLASIRKIRDNTLFNYKRTLRHDMYSRSCQFGQAKQPIILTRKVPNGKNKIFFSNIFPIPYLKIVPINPPKPIKMIFFIFLI